MLDNVIVNMIMITVTALVMSQQLPTWGRTSASVMGEHLLASCC